MYKKHTALTGSGAELNEPLHDVGTQNHTKHINSALKYFRRYPTKGQFPNKG